jgi:TPR repeat protein
MKFRILALLAVLCVQLAATPVFSAQARDLQIEKLGAPEVEKMAKAGDAKAQLRLGHMYKDGNGVAKDPAKAAHWWQKAAEQGNAEAQYNLGLAYEKGEGVPQDKTKAVQWHQKAAVQGYGDSLTALHKMQSRQDSSAALKAGKMPFKFKALPRADKGRQGRGARLLKSLGVMDEQATAELTSLVDSLTIIKITTNNGDAAGGGIVEGLPKTLKQGESEKFTFNASKVTEITVETDLGAWILRKQ